MLTDTGAEKLKMIESESDAAGRAKRAGSELPLKSLPLQKNQSELFVTSKAAAYRWKCARFFLVSHR